MIKNQRGFTLLELMVIVSIIGVLATLAIPAYQNYTIRVKVTEGLTLASGAKITVAENAFSGNPSLNAGFASPGVTGNISDLAVDAISGTITVTFNASAGNGTLVMVPIAGGSALIPGTAPTGAIEWACTGGTLDKRYRPHNCR